MIKLALFASGSGSNVENIYEYLVQRAYPESIEISRDLKIPLPPVEFIAGSMRETKSGDMKHRADDSSAVWGLYPRLYPVQTH